ncbi:MAG: SDR family NAD(P)-dependent oxidoreductase, partial [Gammaproteobacteria bacterium]|nr:SDR family NAD(P)-dependent oxidoreductase [Gammaproteobacteria bacterium]
MPLCGQIKGTFLCAGSLFLKRISIVGNGNQKTVVITGGSRGIGRSVALRFAEDRPRIIIAHYDPDEVEANKTLDELAQRG